MIQKNRRLVLFRWEWPQSRFRTDVCIQMFIPLNSQPVSSSHLLISQFTAWINIFTWDLFISYGEYFFNDVGGQGVNSAVTGTPICMRPKVGILRPLANPETLKNLPRCNFEKPAYGNGPLFKLILKKNTPTTHPNTPRRGRRGVRGWVFGVFGWVFGVFFQMILKKCPFSEAWFFKIIHRQAFQEATIS